MKNAIVFYEAKTKPGALKVTDVRRRFNKFKLHLAEESGEPATNLSALDELLSSQGF